MKVRKSPRDLFAALVVCLFPVAACSPEQKELGRRISPDQRLVAVLMESMTGGAAGSVHEDIYINDRGLPLTLDNPVFGAIGCDHLSFEWANEYTLQIHYDSVCTIKQFTNRWIRPSDLAVGRPNPVEIILVRS